MGRHWVCAPPEVDVVREVEPRGVREVLRDLQLELEGGPLGLELLLALARVVVLDPQLLDPLRAHFVLMRLLLDLLPLAQRRVRVRGHVRDGQIEALHLLHDLEYPAVYSPGRAAQAVHDLDDTLRAVPAQARDGGVRGPDERRRLHEKAALGVLGGRLPPARLHEHRPVLRRDKSQHVFLREVHHRFSLTPQHQIAERLGLRLPLHAVRKGGDGDEVAVRTPPGRFEGLSHLRRKAFALDLDFSNL
mmetsp:Transcript_27345/g.79251  ORF Transcript_27345/g.79251 Transcript_27345/m.79251 type:complete len:247 (-) Transcript_27345:30-770(-)